MGNPFRSSLHHLPRKMKGVPSGTLFSRWVATVPCLAILLGAFLLISACGTPDQKLIFSTEYQAVFLDNGQVFYGKLENAGSAYPSLKDAFYLQTQTNPETKEVRTILIKRGSEWHGPDMMYINARHIVAMEPVSASSRVAQLIKEAKAQKAGSTP
jgi:hypothetical protein